MNGKEECWEKHKEENLKKARKKGRKETTGKEIHKTRE